MPKVGKPKSKRVSVRLRHRIEQSSSAKQRKDRKEAKKNPQWRSRLKKDPGVPNLFPYKAKVLAELEEGKRRKEEEQQRRRELAKAQREGRKVAPVIVSTAGAEDDDDDDDVLLDEADDDDEEVMEGVDVQESGSSNPMAALIASAQARAQNYGRADLDEDEDDDDDDDEEEEDEDSHPAALEKHASQSSSRLASSTKKALPKKALADPIKAASALVDRMQQTDNGIQTLLDFYHIPPLVTAGSDLTTRFLVDVARKRGRLGKGGVPNLHAAALTVLSDLNEERLRLPAEELKRVKTPASAAAAENKGQVQIVQTMAEPFRLEGLWGDDGELLGASSEEMVMEA